MDNKPQEEEKKPRRRAKKAKGHAGHHGGAWKVAFADFMTAMMALFLVLWLVSQADMKLKQSIAAYFRSPGVFDYMQGGVLSQAKKVTREPENLTSKDDEQVLFAVAQMLQKKFESRPEFTKIRDRVKIEVTEEGLKIEIIDKAEEVSFPSGSAKLTPEAEAILIEIAQTICELPNLINIGGHTDSRPFPSADNSYTNWELSADRANSARRVLEANCVKPKQINRIVGYADTDLMVPNDPYAPANRRISIMVLRLVVATDEASETPETSGEINPKVVEKAVPGKETKPASTPEKKADANSNKPVVNALPEKKLAEKKLQTDGAVVVGTPDPIPVKPKEK
jgi:chemotaxis protein MotB